ncbi:uncharacterized protein LOC141913383 [Tubulanus polymorphus]|uniref:uncharacterized protein LOC141913383 n=1 Tax=Tubulanus polymorphus TaxID=672921 RepID=UPI003DA5EF3B
MDAPAPEMEAELTPGNRTSATPDRDVICYRLTGIYRSGDIMLITRVVLYLIGVVANTVAYSVLTVMTRQGSSVFYLRMLAIADAVNCLTTFIGRDLKALTSNTLLKFLRYVRWYKQYRVHLYPLVDAVCQMTSATSSWILYALNVDRYIAIRYPLSAMNLCTISNSKRISSIVWIATFIFHLPKVWDKAHAFGSGPCSFAKPRRLLLANYKYAFYYDFIFGQVISRFIPGIAIFIFNVHMFALMGAARRNRRRFKTKNSSVKLKATDTSGKLGTQITLTIMTLNVFYCAQYTFMAINTIIPALSKLNGGPKISRPYHEGQLVQSINAMMNLFVYLCIRSGFAETLVWCLSCGSVGNRK